MKKWISFVLLLCLLVTTAFCEQAQNIAGQVKYSSFGGKTYARLSDGKYRLVFETKADKAPYLEIQSEQEIAAVQVKWETLPGKWHLQVMQDGAWQNVQTQGEEGHAVEFIAVPNAKKLRITGQFEKNQKLKIFELELYTAGELPKHVQQWQSRDSKADMLLLVAHPDDELIFMGGLIPSFAEHSGKQLQVAYITCSDNMRRYELLHALWHCGLMRYPEIGPFYDRYSKTVKQAYAMWKKDKVLQYTVDLIRKHKPEVVVTHDVFGEYGHGAHRAAADLCLQAFDLAADESYKTDFAPWQAKKLYVHLGNDESKTIHMDWKQPLNAFGGKTSLQVADEAWVFHKSQHGGRADFQGRTFFFQIADGGVFDNAKFSLLKTTVGEDVAKNDFFENIH